ncbi:hypothetical protein [Marinicrinis lubricantis]|uniref:Uncharacterized protein n=1 Tax=Marinicrinis lubricantis TaxID=2086470 RepID=A0ABW1IT02_9BACL
MNNLHMRWAGWIMMMLCGCFVLASCGHQVVHASFLKQGEFEVFLELPDTELHAGESFVAETSLVNLTDKTYEIHHGVPLIFIEIETDHWSDVEPKVNLVLDVEATMNPHEVYDPDTENFINGRRTLMITSPGKYRLTASAHFNVYNPDKEKYEGVVLRSEPMEVEVKP